MKIRCMNCMKVYEDSLKSCPKCGFERGTRPREIYHLYPETELGGRYVIGTVVGFGGFGVLYRAWDKKLEHMVAIKEYYPVGMVTRIPGQKDVILYTGKKNHEYKNGLTRFLDEARNTAKFNGNPHIVNVYDFFEENGTAYMVMEFLEGCSLKEYIAARGERLPWQQAVELGISLIEALKDVHGAGILHRDISPDNIFMCSDGAVKLLDFGAARFAEKEDINTRSIVLKMGFAPPEQYRGKGRQGPYTDIYALGATLYKAITGITPDESVNRAESAAKTGKDTLAPISEVIDGVPAYLEHAILKSMALEPDLRFQGVLQMKAALTNQKVYRKPEQELKHRKRIRVVGIAAICLVLVAGSVSGLLFFQWKKRLIDLGQVELSVWMPVREGMDEAETEELFMEMSGEFREQYPSVTVKVTCIPPEEYNRSLLDAADAGALPDLYESGGLADELDGWMGRLDQEVYQRLGADGSASADGTTALVPGIFNGDTIAGLGRKQVPLGFGVVVAYVNKGMDNAGLSAKEDNNGRDFLNARSKLWVSDTGRFDDVQQNLAGRYAVKPVEAEPVPAFYTDIWSVNSRATALRQAAAGRLLYFLLRPQAQDVLHLRHDSALPVNEETYRIYLEVNSELDFLDSQVEALEFMAFGEEEKAANSIYKNMMSD